LLKILFIGDVFGEPGRLTVARQVPKLREELSLDFVVANGENSAGRAGITRDIALDMFDHGVDVITLGDHAWSRKEAWNFMDEEPRLLRPANYPPGAPGRGSGLFMICADQKVGVVNLCGRIFMDALDDPFRTSDGIIETLRQETDVILIDFHAEATSEKMAFGWYVDGRVSAVVGTHTHVQTADERVLPGGTAYITDVGMTGPTDSVIGVKKEIVISKFLTGLPVKFEVAQERVLLSAVTIDVDVATGRASGIERLLRQEARTA
jgi:2',3'-cyclic-nucleotide 2'-phosphodiesterase